MKDLYLLPDKSKSNQTSRLASSLQEIQKGNLLKDHPMMQPAKVKM